jgi:hypothetical protein
MTLRAGLAVLALVLLPSRPGDAASPAHHVHVSFKVTPRSGTHGCPSELELRRDVTTILGYAPFDSRAPRRVTAVLSFNGGSFSARIELVDVRSGRSLGLRTLFAAGPTCAELGAATALAIALAIDPLARPPSPVAATPAAPLSAVDATTPGALSAATVSTPAPRAQAPPRAELPPPPSPAVSPSAEVDAGPMPLAEASRSEQNGAVDAGPPLPSPPVEQAAPASGLAAPAQLSAPDSTAERAWHGLLGAGADWTLGLVPRHAFGVVLHGGVAWAFASVELEVRWLPSTSLAFESGTISSTLVTGALVGCATLGDFGACGLFQAGPLSSTGNGFVQSQSSTTWATALGARAQWDWVFAHPVGVRVQADGLLNLVRTRLLVGPDAVWRAPSFGFAGGAGLFLVF